MPVPGWLNRLMIGYYQGESRVLRGVNLPFGLSVVCVAQKPRRARADAPEAAARQYEQAPAAPRHASTAAAPRRGRRRPARPGSAAGSSARRRACCWRRWSCLSPWSSPAVGLQVRALRPGLRPGRLRAGHLEHGPGPALRGLALQLHRLDLRHGLDAAAGAVRAVLRPAALGASRCSSCRSRRGARRVARLPAGARRLGSNRARPGLRPGLAALPTVEYAVLDPFQMRIFATALLLVRAALSSSAASWAPSCSAPAWPCWRAPTSRWW